MNSPSRRPSLTAAGFLLLALLTTALAMFGPTDFFPASFTASSSSAGIGTAKTSPVATTAPDKKNQARVTETFFPMTPLALDAACNSHFDAKAVELMPTLRREPMPPAQNGKIAFLSLRDGDAEIYIMNPDGTNQINLTNNPADDQHPSFSPDGSKIVFYSQRDNGDSEIYVMDSDGTNQNRLTNRAGTDFLPVFSPDGSKIAFQSDRDGNSEIYVMNSDGTNQTNLSNNPEYDGEPAFSPDGSKIAFTRIRGANVFDIYIMNSDGTNQVNLTNNPGGVPPIPNDHPSFSPDGSKIVFRRAMNNTSEIYLMNSDGTAQTLLTNNGANNNEPVFSPDGTRVVFASVRAGADIYVIDSDGANEHALTDNPAYDGSPSWGVATTSPTPTPTPTPTSDGLQYYPLAHPVRLLDTRAGTTACYTPAAPLTANASRTQAAVGTCDGLAIPPTAKAIVGNATVVSPPAAGHIILYPAGAQQPVVSNLNYVAGQIVPNAFTVGLSAGGAFNIYTPTQTHFIIDMSGYFAP